ncbi:hypothetical protein Bca101_057722 [Brassica carinata]
MVTNSEITMLKNLKPYKTTWKIEGQKIHASYKRNLTYRVQRDTKPGEWREVENFKISSARGQYRPSKFQYKITIIGDTVIRPTDYRNDNHFLSLASYEEIDVIGQVVDLGEVAMCQLTTGENRKRVQFRLRDTSGSKLACCLWGPYADQIESHVEESKSKDEPIIEDPDVLPIPNKNIVGKSFCFGISIKSDNVTSGSDTFKVSQVWSGDHIHRIESLSEPVSMIESNSSTLSTGEDCLIDQNRESSSDVSTPFSKRKEGDAELNDMNSTSKKLCAQSIKMEKIKED